MKLTTKKLKQLIREELRALSENTSDNEHVSPDAAQIRYRINDVIKFIKPYAAKKQEIDDLLFMASKGSKHSQSLDKAIQDLKFIRDRQMNLGTVAAEGIMALADVVPRIMRDMENAGLSRNAGDLQYFLNLGKQLKKDPERYFQDAEKRSTNYE